LNFRGWWNRKSGRAKVVAVLATLLVLQIGLCWTNPRTVLPLYLWIFGPSSDSELGLGLSIWQGILSIVTFFFLLIALALRPGDADKHNSTNEDPNEQ
jgi:riboflavin transporter FmnP